MLQYLLNATMIWLLSLLVFDIFLRKESYHSYNRLYLLLTLLLGIFLPLLQWQQSDIIYTIGAAKPIATAIYTKQAVIQAATIEPAGTVSWEQWIWLTYYTGVVISSILLIKEIVILGRYFKSGTRSIDGVWTITETGKQHSPFSAFRYLFISSKEDYEPAELHMILVHEKQHGQAFHFIDTLLVELAKIVFWFHPLVYIFQKRLLILHEYQADAAVENAPKEYGEFLIEQSMLQSAPALSHSLNRSPIKKRIVMLTRKSSLAAGFKRLVAFPLGIICIFLFTEIAVSKDNKRDNKLYYNGNEFELGYTKSLPFYVVNSPQYKLLSITGIPDSVTAQNPRTGYFEKIASTIDTFPAKMNGRDIFRVYDLAQADSIKYNSITGGEIRNFLLENLSAIGKNAPDGYYGIFQYMILDDNGNIAYIQQPRARNGNSKYELSAAKVEAELFKAIQNTSRKFTPIKRGGKAEIMRVPAHMLEVKDHKVYISVQTQYGC